MKMTQPKPSPFCFNKSKVKAFVLGADPPTSVMAEERSQNSLRLRHRAKPQLFPVDPGQLNALGLHLEDLYIQNLLPESREKKQVRIKIM
ncbi:MAG: hypothetical protein U5Q03_00025 [Bacteroidota bacterium]|nr:hypothetical protein [Bacteroidota bacterium]